MQPPEEQNLKPEGMDTETPLLVLKPLPGRSRLLLIGRGLVFVSFLHLSLSSFFFLQSRWEYIGFFEIMRMIGMPIFVFTMFISGIKAIDALFVLSFKLYSDRAKKWYVFWKRVVYLKDAKISIDFGKNSNYFGYLYVTPNGSCFYRFLNRIKYDLDLGVYRVDAANVINSCGLAGIKLKKTDNFFSEKYEQI